MAIGYFGAIGSTNSKTSGTTLTATATGAGIGESIFLWIVFDNTGTTTPTVSSITKAGGETNAWSLVGAFDSPVSGSGSGLRGELWKITATVAWSTFTPVITFSAAITAKCVVGGKFGEVGTLLGANDASQTSGTAASVSTPT